MPWTQLAKKSFRSFILSSNSIHSLHLRLFTFQFLSVSYVSHSLALSAAKSFFIHFQSTVAFSERFLFATTLRFWNPDEPDFVHLLNVQERVETGKKYCTRSNPLSLVSGGKTQHPKCHRLNLENKRTVKIE